VGFQFIQFNTPQATSKRADPRTTLVRESGILAVCDENEREPTVLHRDSDIRIEFASFARNTTWCGSVAHCRRNSRYCVESTSLSVAIRLSAARPMRLDSKPTTRARGTPPKTRTNDRYELGRVRLDWLHRSARPGALYQNSCCSRSLQICRRVNLRRETNFIRGRVQFFRSLVRQMTTSADAWIGRHSKVRTPPARTVSNSPRIRGL